MKKYMLQFYGVKGSRTFSYVVEHWKQCGGRVNDNSFMLYGDDNILAEFLLTSDFPDVRIKEV